MVKGSNSIPEVKDLHEDLTMTLIWTASLIAHGCSPMLK